MGLIRVVTLFPTQPWKCNMAPLGDTHLPFGPSFYTEPCNDYGRKSNISMLRIFTQQQNAMESLPNIGFGVPRGLVGVLEGWGWGGGSGGSGWDDDNLLETCTHAWGCVKVTTELFCLRKEDRWQLMPMTPIVPNLPTNGVPTLLLGRPPELIFWSNGNASLEFLFRAKPPT